MGCWDIYCCLCGNSCKSYNNLSEILLEQINNKEINLDKINKNTKWLNKCTFLSADGLIVHNCKEIMCNNVFMDNKKNIYYHQTYFENNNIKYGIFVHTDCWKFIYKEYKIKLSYNYLPINKLLNISYKIFNFINYGKIEKYWDQNFNYINLILDGFNELYLSPLKSNLVGKNIKKIFVQLKIRYDKNRQSPPTSATFYKNNMYKIGNNNNIWMTKNNKWIELKNTIKYKINNINIIKNKCYSKDVNTEPIFIYKIKNNKEIEIISTDDIKNKLIFNIIK